MQTDRATSILALAIFHPLAYCGLIGAALIFLHNTLGEKHPLFEHTAIQAVVGGALSLVLVIVHPIAALLVNAHRERSADEGLQLLALELRLPVEDPDGAARRLLEGMADRDHLIRRAGEWTIVVEPMLPPAQELEGPGWGPLREGFHDAYPEYAQRLEGAFAFRIESGAIDLAVFVPRRKLPLLDDIDYVRAVEKLRWAAWRLANAIRPTRPPAMPLGLVDDASAPAGRRLLWDLVRQALAPMPRRRMDPETAWTAARSVAAAAWMSAGVGTLAVILGGLRPELGMIVGLVSAAGLAMSWGAYQVSFRRQVQIQEALFGAPASGLPGPRDLPMLVRAFLVSLAMAVFASLAIQVSGLNAYVPRGDIREARKIAILATILALAFVFGMGWWGYERGRRDARRAFEATGTLRGMV